MSNLQDKINKLDSEIEAIKMLLDYICRKPDPNGSMPVEGDKFHYYKSLARDRDVKKLSTILNGLQDELIRKENLLLQERQAGMFNTYDHYFDD
jgi:hypothetical protein